MSIRAGEVLEARLPEAAGLRMASPSGNGVAQRRKNHNNPGGVQPENTLEKSTYGAFRLRSGFGYSCSLADRAQSWAGQDNWHAEYHFWLAAAPVRHLYWPQRDDAVGDGT